MQYQSYLKYESYGFNPENFWGIVDGVVESIEMAESSAVRGKMFWKSGNLDANENRRPDAYDQNVDKDDYESMGNTDKEMVLLKIVDIDGNPLGGFTWWPVLPIIFNRGFNALVTADNRGYAAHLFDTEIKKQGEAAQNFVSGFGSSNQGDVIPAYLIPGNFPIQFRIEELRDHATSEFRKALELFNANDLKPVTGPIKVVHQYVNATEQYVRSNSLILIYSAEAYFNEMV